jgi:hypothetical protein
VISCFPGLPLGGLPFPLFFHLMSFLGKSDCGNKRPVPDKTAGIQPQPLCTGNVIIRQAAFLFGVLPELFVVCHSAYRPFTIFLIVSYHRQQNNTEESMEIKINKEIRAYRETLFFGLSVRQFICSVLAVGVAVTLYFSLSRVLDRETVSWVCIVGAAPVAAAGFFQYNGLTLERFLWAWLKSEVIMAGKRVWKAENYYEEAMKREVKKH